MVPAFAAVMILAGVVFTASCGNGLYPEVTSSRTPTATPTQAAGGAFLYVTNYADGTISEFSRNLTTGALTLIGTVSAGSKNGPKGIAIDPSNRYLYATNFKDGTVLEFNINGTTGALTAIGAGSVSDGANSGPEQIAISPSGNFLWVTDFKASTITIWTITSGALGSKATFSGAGMVGPFGLAINSAGTILFMSDYAQGVIYALSVNTSTGALTNSTGSPVLSEGTFGGTPGLPVLSPNGANMVVGDESSVDLSLFQINSTTPYLQYLTSAAAADPQPFGASWASVASNTIVVTANQSLSSPTNGSVSSFILSGTALLSSNNVLGINEPTELAVDPQNVYAYTADQGDGTVAQYQFNAVCGGTTQTICYVKDFADEKPANPSSGPFGIALTH